MAMVSSPGGKGNSQDFELNLAPIIDCLVVLIAFLLVSASFLSITLLDAGVEAQSSSVQQIPPSISIEVKLLANSVLQLTVQGKENLTQNIKAGPESRNYDELIEVLQKLKAKWNDVNALTLTGQDDVSYEEMIQAMDQLRKIYPVITLGGF